MLDDLSLNSHRKIHTHACCCTFLALLPAAATALRAISRKARRSSLAILPSLQRDLLCRHHA